MTHTTITHYEVLGVGPLAETETVRKAYRRLARKHHPDVSTDPRAQENMARINEAYETLIDPPRRREYDAFLNGGGVQNRREAPPKPIVVKLHKRLVGHRTPIYGLAYHPDEPTLVSSAFDNEVRWWKEDEIRQPLRIENGVVSVLRALSMDRVVAAGSAENQVSIHRIEGEKTQQWKTSAEEWVGCLAISPDGSSVATGSLHQTVSVLSALDGSTIWRNARHDGSVMAVAYSGDGRLLATGGSDATVMIWSAMTGEPLGRLTQMRGAVTAIAFSPDTKYLAVAGVDLSIRIFRLEPDAGAIVGELYKVTYGHTKAVESLAFHRDSWLLASGSRDGTVGLWAAGKGLGNVRIEASARPISSVAFSADGTRLASAGQDKMIRLWDVQAKEVEMAG